MNYEDPTQLKAFLEERIREKSEKDKLDFKRDLLGWDKGEALVDQLNLLRLINAFANTFSREFDDYGFLIFGADKSDGKVAFDIPVLRSKGSDKLQSEIANQVKKYMHPIPQFEVYDFTEGALTWGAIVVPPRQRGPFVFIKESPNWRVGEWRVRHAAQVSPPLQSDYDRVFELHLAPLRVKVDELREENARLKGIIGTFEQQKKPLLSLQPVQQSLKAASPATARKLECERQARKLGIPNLLEEFRLLKPAKPMTHKEITTARLQGVSPALPAILQPFPQTKFTVEQERIDELLENLSNAGLTAKPEEFIFRDLSKTRDLSFTGSSWGGGDLPRFRLFCDIETKFEEIRHYAEQAEKNAGCTQVKLILQNDGDVAVESLKIGVQLVVTSVGHLINEVPDVETYVEPRSPYDLSVDYARLSREAARVHRVEGGISVGGWEEKLAVLRPKERYEIRIPLRLIRNGDLNLIINVKASNLAVPFEETIPYQVQVR